MSIVPISEQQGTIYSPFSPDLWDPFKNFHEDLFSLDVWDPFTSFPFGSHFPEIFPSLETQINWRETQKAHVFKAVLPGLTKDDVIIFVDDENMLQISSEDGKFMSRFKLPQNAKVDQVKASMQNGVLTVTVAKEVSVPNVRIVEISG